MNLSIRASLSSSNDSWYMTFNNVIPSSCGLTQYSSIYPNSWHQEQGLQADQLSLKSHEWLPSCCAVPWGVWLCRLLFGFALTSRARALPVSINNPLQLFSQEEEGPQSYTTLLALGSMMMIFCFESYDIDLRCSRSLCLKNSQHPPI